MIEGQEVNRFDLLKCTFIIPLRIETADRMRNIITTLIYLTRNFACRIIVKEVDNKKIVPISEVKEETGVTLSEPIEKLYEEDNITFYRAPMPDEKITLSHEHDEHKFVTKDSVPENISGKFKRAIKKAL